MQYLYSIRLVMVGALALMATALTALTLYDAPPTTTSMYLSPLQKTVAVGDTVRMMVMVESAEAVNAFSGELVFPNDVFTIASISYNTSIANLWVEEPWYNRANNSVYFAGGTNKPGGFTGRGELLAITLQATQPGTRELRLDEVRMMLHDGLGTDARLATPLDAIFTATAATSSSFQFRPQVAPTSQVVVAEQLPSPDVNGDGEINFFDIGILITQLGSDNQRYDLNGDGVVNTRDFAVIQAAR